MLNVEQDRRWKVVFENAVTAGKTPSGLRFVRTMQFELNVRCTFDRIVRNISTQVDITESTVVSDGTEGVFSFESSYFTNAGYEAISTNDDAKIVGKIVYYGICNEHGNTFNIIDNGCPIRTVRTCVLCAKLAL